MECILHSSFVILMLAHIIALANVLTTKLLQQQFLMLRLKSFFKIFCGHHHDLVDRYKSSVTSMMTNIFVILSVCFTLPFHTLWWVWHARRRCWSDLCSSLTLLHGLGFSPILVCVPWTLWYVVNGYRSLFFTVIYTTQKNTVILQVENDWHEWSSRCLQILSQLVCDIADNVHVYL